MKAYASYKGKRLRSSTRTTSPPEVDRSAHTRSCSQPPPLRMRRSRGGINVDLSSMVALLALWEHLANICECKCGLRWEETRENYIKIS